MFDRATIQEIILAAEEFSMEPAALLAVADVESGGRAYAVVKGRREPLIRFEGHYFDRRLSPALRTRARREGLAAPKAGQIPNPKGQAGRWQLFERAAAMNRRAACESVSWGLGQVMGAHWERLGYADVEALVAEARSSASGQARLMARYVARFGLAPLLQAHDWTGFARAYNGPGYRRNAYDEKLRAAYFRFSPGAENGPEAACGQG